MSGPALSYRYAYPFASEIAPTPQAPQLRLATFTDEDTTPYFFEGELLRPHLIARLLQDLSRLVRTRFFMPIDPFFLDPVVTSHGDFLRFEVFTGCCSAYARLDLPPESLSGTTLGCGTTNVDFNPQMLAALGKVRPNDNLALQVGADEVAISGSGGRVVEKKVQLPLRWLKGLIAVTAYSKVLECVHEIDGIAAAKFLRSLPRSVDNRSRYWIVRSGKTLRLSMREAPNAVACGAVNRLRVLEDCIAAAKKLRIYGHADVDASGWEIDFGDARFSMVMTHDVWRGFSGEGQGLLELTQKPAEKILQNTTAALQWQSILAPEAIADKHLKVSEIERGLSYLSTLGKVGFDMRAGQYYHRQLPFDVDFVSALQPRLKNAKKLVDTGCVQHTKPQTFDVKTTDAVHIVRLLDESYKCTCTWYAKHQDRRGPCKHVLAAQIWLDQQPTKN
ncbi:MAG: hypothetical protein R3C53_28525 [Pirellulaceae bacterium]